MATMPQQSQDDTSQDPAEQPMSVTVTDNGDGTYSVSSNDEQDQGEEPSEPQTADSLQDACKIMAQMFGEETDEEQSEPSDGSDGNATMSPEDAASAWKQMASKKAKSKGM